MDGGQVGKKRLLSPEAVDRALTPDQPMSNYPQTIKGMDVSYGQQWVVYGQRNIFGHSGSDGTHAWAWPEEDLMVLFFTQSRGTLAGVGIEPLLQTLLVDQKLDDPSLTMYEPDAGQLAQVSGMYWDETNDTAYYVVTPRGNRLIVERPGSMQLVFKADKTPGRFVHEAASQIWIEFLRAEDGAVTAMRYAFGGPVETGPRFTPANDLPTVEDVITSVMKFHRIDRLSEIGAVRLSGNVKIEARKMEGPITSLFDATRGRTEIVFGTVEQLAITNGGRAWSGASLSGFEELEGQLKEQALLDQFIVRFGDWTKHYQHVEVLKRIAQGDNNMLLVRVEPHQGTGSTMFVHEESGRMVLMHSLTQLPGMGIVGVKARFGDYRDVGGMQLPFRTEAKFATPLIGVVNTVFDEVEVGVDVTDESFSVPTASEGDPD